MTLRDENVERHRTRRKHKQSIAPADPASAADSLAGDRLDGAAAIADFLGIDRKRAYHLLAKDHIPVVREGDKYIGSKRRLIKHYTGE